MIYIGMQSHVASCLLGNTRQTKCKNKEYLIEIRYFRRPTRILDVNITPKIQEYSVFTLEHLNCSYTFHRMKSIKTQYYYVMKMCYTHARACM
jgi:hypothetical protein